MADKQGWLWHHSVAVCRRPRLVVSLCFAVTLACSLGLFRVSIITNPDLIWVPPNSRANRQKEFFDSAFSPFFRVNQVYFVASEMEDSVDKPDMINTQYLQRVMSVQRAIETANFTSAMDGQSTNFASLCFKPIDGEGCLVESPSQYWLKDPVLLGEDPSPSLTASCQTTEPFLASRSPCMDKIGTPVMRQVVFGDLGTNADVISPDPCGGGVPAAGALVLTFLLNNYQDSNFQRLAEQWEKEVFLAIVEEARDVLGNDVQVPMKVSYMAQRSVEDSLSVEAGENAWVLIVSYLLMFLYVALVLGKPCHPIRSRYSLALSGITIVVASLGTAIGLLSVFGVGTTLIVWEVVPFLTLAIGVDNMVILSREFDRLAAAPEFEASASAVHTHSPLRHRDSDTDIFTASHEATCSGPTYAWARDVLVGRGDSRFSSTHLEERMGAAVSKVAPSILGAAVCEAGAFYVGALTDIPALRQFCLVAATAVVVGFVLQVTWFMACLSLDARRVSQGRLDVAPWVTLESVRTKRKAVWPPAPSYLDNPVERPGYSSIGINAPLLEPDSPPPLHLPARYTRPERRHHKIARTQSIQNSGRGSSVEKYSKPSAAGGCRVLVESDDLADGYSPEGKGSMPRVINDFDQNDEGSDYDFESVGNVSEEEDIERYPGGREHDDNDGLYHHDGEGNAKARQFTSDFDTGDGVSPPPLFPQKPSTSGIPASPLRSDSDRGKNDEAGKQSRRRRRGWGRGKALGDVDYRNGNMVGVGGGDLDGGAHGDDAAAGGPEGTVEHRNGKLEKWFRSPHDHESEAVSMLSEQPRHDLHQQRLFNAISPSTEVPTSGAGVPNGAHGQINNPGDRDMGGKHPWFSDGVAGDGYVSLTSRLDSNLVHRRGTGDEVHAGGDGEEASACGGGGWRCGSGGLAMFREQLYEEGRSKGTKGNLASRMLDRYYLPVLFSRGGRVVTLLAAAGLAVLGGFGLFGLRMGLEPQLAAPTDFYLQGYYHAQFTLGEAGPPAYIVFTDVDYFRAFNDSDSRQRFTGVSNGLAQLQRYVQVPIYSWFDTMVAWINQASTLAADCPAQIEITDEASFYAMVDTFLSIPIESQCCQSYGVCGAQFETDVAFDNGGGEEGDPRRIRASRLRFNLQPLMTQRDFVNSYYYIKVAMDQLADELPERYEGQREANEHVGNLAFPYSLYFVFYEQYAYIQGVALQNIALALAVVFIALGVLSGFAIASVVTALVLGTTLGTVGLVWAWGELSSAPFAVSINAVSVCNLVMSLGLSVEFCLHVAIAFQSVPGTRQERAEAAMRSAGASVLTGITLTKLVGVSVLAIAPSLLFRVYYFRMYMATVFAGAFQGLAVLPVVLSMYGPTAPPNVRGSNAHIPRGSRSPSWMLDKQHDQSASPYFGSPTAAASSEAVGGGYYDLKSGAPGGALGWNWGGGGHDVHGNNSGWEKSGEFAMDDGARENLYRRGDMMGGSNNSGTGLSLPPATLSQDDLVQ